jgi:hypothetical protein
MNSRPQVLEVRACDTKPIWEQVLKGDYRNQNRIIQAFGRIEAVMRENRAHLRDVEDRPRGRQNPNLPNNSPPQFSFRFPSSTALQTITSPAAAA